MSPQAILFIMIISLAYLLVLFTLPALFIKRAMAQVIGIFRSHAATEARNAKTIDELGLRPESFINRIGKLRDYKPMALDILMSAEVIVQVFDGRVYLSEKGLKILCENDADNRLGLCDLAGESEF